VARLLHPLLVRAGRTPVTLVRNEAYRHEITREYDICKPSIAADVASEPRRVTPPLMTVERWWR
jgi:hypothetical protein